jgi:hypothetical protein
VCVGIGQLVDATVLIAASDTLRQAHGDQAESVFADLDAHRRTTLETRLEPTTRKAAEHQGGTMPLRDVIDFACAAMLAVEPPPSPPPTPPGSVAANRSCSDWSPKA